MHCDQYYPHEVQPNQVDKEKSVNNTSPFRKAVRVDPFAGLKTADYYIANISDFDPKTGKCIVDQCTSAQLAAGLLVQPCVGDLVACVQTQGAIYVIQILQTMQDDKLQLSSVKPMFVNAPSISLMAEDELNMVSLNRFSLVGKHGVMSVAASLVTRAEYMIQNISEWMVTAKGMMRLSARQQVITAEEDVRIDGKRINMG